MCEKGYEIISQGPSLPLSTVEGERHSDSPQVLCGTDVFSEYLSLKYSMNESYTFQADLNQRESTLRNLGLGRAIVHKSFFFNGFLSE